MIFLIQEETTVFTFGMNTRIENRGYYECDNEQDVKAFCKTKTEEMKGTYDDSRLDKKYIYKKLSKLN